MDKYEVKISRHVILADGWRRDEYETRRFADEKEAKAFCWSMRPAGKPTWKYSADLDEENSIAVHKVWQWGTWSDTVKIDIEYTEYRA